MDERHPDTGARIPETYWHYLERAEAAQNAASRPYRHHDVHEAFDAEQREPWSLSTRLGWFVAVLSIPGVWGGLVWLAVSQ